MKRDREKTSVLASGLRLVNGIQSLKTDKSL